MATPTSGNGNLVDEFEEAFQSCLNVLTKEEAVPCADKDEIRAELDQTTLRFIDLARQMEAFFLQKRFLLSALKPELVVKEDISELRMELLRKEELLKRHYDKISVWQNLLSDLQGYVKSPAQGAAAGVAPNGGPVSQSPVQVPLNGAQPPGQLVPALGQMSAQQQLQQVQLQQLQLQQQLQQQIQVPAGLAGGAPVAGPASIQQAMFLQQQQQGLGGGRGQFAQGGPLQGPLAFLEKTTSNIGIGDGRR